VTISDVQDPIQVLNRGSVKVKVKNCGKLMEKKVQYRQTNQMVWQIRRTFQGGWTDFANELTPEDKVRVLIRKEFDVRY